MCRDSGGRIDLDSLFGESERIIPIENIRRGMIERHINHSKTVEIGDLEKGGVLVKSWL